MILVVMGVSGVGKTTIGRALAEKLGARFVDADDLHPQSNVDKMARGEPLSDDDRAPWLMKLARTIDGWLAADEDVVLAASALKRAHRKALRRDPARVRFIHLTGAPALIAARLSTRVGHFMPPALLQSQLEALELPQDALTVDVDGAPDEIVGNILQRLQGG